MFPRKFSWSVRAAEVALQNAPKLASMLDADSKSHPAYWWSEKTWRGLEEAYVSNPDAEFVCFGCASVVFKGQPGCPKMNDNSPH